MSNNPDPWLEGCIDFADRLGLPHVHTLYCDYYAIPMEEERLERQRLLDMYHSFSNQVLEQMASDALEQNRMEDWSAINQVLEIRTNAYTMSDHMGLHSHDPRRPKNY